MDTPAYDESIFEEPTPETIAEEPVEEGIDLDPVEEAPPEEPVEEGEEEPAQPERKYANKYVSQDELVKGYTHLANIYRERVEQIAGITGDSSYLDLLKNIGTEFETVEDLEEGYRLLNNDYQRQARTLNAMKKQAPAQAPQQPPAALPPNQQTVIPPELGQDPTFMNLMQTNPMQAVQHLVQYQVQRAVQQREQTFQQELMYREQQNQMYRQVAALQQKPDFEELREDIIEVMTELPVLAHQPQGLQQAYEYAQLKKMRRELSENAVTAQQIKINQQAQKRKASAPHSATAKGGPAPSPDEEIINQMLGQGSGLSRFLE